MTREAQRIAIAEACPQVIRQNTSLAGYWAENPCWEWFDGFSWRQCFDNDPLNDLNAMQAAEKTLNHEQYRAFSIALSNLVYPRVHSATAAPRAEAFLRALNLWKE